MTEISQKVMPSNHADCTQRRGRSPGQPCFWFQAGHSRPDLYLDFHSPLKPRLNFHLDVALFNQQMISYDTRMDKHSHLGHFHRHKGNWDESWLQLKSSRFQSTYPEPKSHKKNILLLLLWLLFLLLLF